MIMPTLGQVLGGVIGAAIVVAGRFAWSVYHYRRTVRRLEDIYQRNRRNRSVDES